MTSEKQIAANRENAKKSTGPRTAAGKAITRMNAVRDNYTGQIITLPPEEFNVFEKLKTELMSQLAPANADELRLASAIAWDTWRLDRLRATEMNMFAAYAADAQAEAEEAHALEHIEADARLKAESEAIGDPNPVPRAHVPRPDPNVLAALSDVETCRIEAHRLDNMSLYEQRMTRNLHRNRQALRQIQAERKRIYQKDMREEIVLARFSDLKDQPYQAPSGPSPNGSVFSSEEIRKAAERQRNLEATMYLLSTQAPWKKYGATGAGSPDLFAELLYRAPPDNLPKKIHGVSPESIALRKFYHPEEFERRRR